jgi:P4 family phage/plasmid primase-like protien
MVQPKGKYQFNRLGLETFWDSYCETVNKNPHHIVGVAEKPQQYLPVLVDVDLKIKDNGELDFDEHIYTDEQALNIIKIYQSELRSIVDGCTDSHLLCVLLEKPIYYITANENTYAKNGFHLHFPNLFLSKLDHEVHLLPRVQEKIKQMNIFSNLGIEDSSTVIDKAVVKNPWLLYGSRKSEDMDPYQVTKIFDSEVNELKLEDAFENYELYDSGEDIIKVKGRIQEYLPRILSIVPYGRKTAELKHGLENPLKKTIQFEQKKRNRLPAQCQENISQNLETASKLLHMLSDERSSDRTDWMKVGWILNYISDASQEGLELWLEFSARCDEKYDETQCIYDWNRMVIRNDGVGMGTLHYWASEDSPEKYKEYKNEECQKHMDAALNGSHNDIAKVLQEQYRNEFVCASIANKIWYQFRDHHWEEIEEGVFLRQHISKEIVELFSEKGRELWTKLGQVQDKAEEAMYNARLKQVQKIVSNLKSSPFKNNIMKEAMEVFYNRDFKQKLNKNPNLIGFKNGIYDLKENIFRDGIPDDFISKCIPINYKKFHESDEDIQNVIDFLNKVFPDSSIRTYFLDTYSDIFVGGNTQKKVYLWTGEGDNGKSITQTFFEKMLGELAIKFNTQYFTGKKTSTGSANPELARAAPPIRHATMEEPDADEQLNIGELKKLSGGDSYWARDLFETGKTTKEVFPMFTLTFICNKLPKLKYSDKATWNRLRVIPFESTFVEPGQPCPTTFEEQMLQKRFPMDKTFSSKIPELVEAFAWYLLEWRQKITIRIEPEKVKEATAIYRRQNDIYRQFIEECITEDPKTIISMTELYAQFKEWFREGWANMTLPIKNEVKEYFEKLWGDPLKGIKWKGYRIRTIEEDIANGDAILLGEDDLENYDSDSGRALPPM